MKLLNRLYYSFTLVLIAFICTPTDASEASIQCYDCHGTSIPVDFRPLDAATRDEESGGFQGNHRTHIAAPATPANCAVCHPGSSSYTPAHRDGDITLSSRLNNSPLTTRYRNFTSAWPQTSSPVLGSCSNVNCHFETLTPVWGDPPLSSTSQCNKCHGGAVDLSSTHAVHQRYSTGLMGKFSSYAACASCHVNYASTPSFSHATSAGKRPITVRVGNYNSGSLTYLPSQIHGDFGSCSDLYCHSPGNRGTAPFTPPVQTATWQENLRSDCSGCHKGNYASFSKMSSGSHAKHVFLFNRIDCVTCHSGTVNKELSLKDLSHHVNGAVDISYNNSSTAVNGTYNGSASPVSKTPGTPYGTCTNVYCHSNAQNNGGAGITYTQPTWGNSATGRCGQCHEVLASHNFSGNEISSGSHSPHLAYNSMTDSSAVKCTQCHNWNGQPFNPSCVDQCHTSISSKHANHQIDIMIPSHFGPNARYDSSFTPGNGYSTCTAVYCHSNGTSVTTGSVPGAVSPSWGSGAMQCNGCHGNKTFPDYRKALPLYTSNRPTTKANSHLAHGIRELTCSQCHFGVTTDNTSIASKTLHVNMAYNVLKDNSVSFTYTFKTNGSTCASISCHGNTGATWGSAACLDCHAVAQGKRAVVTGQFVSNSHHVQGTITNAHCYQCHWEARSDGTINPTYHSGAAASGSAVDLVVYGAGIRPAAYNPGTFVTYTANGTRAQIRKISSHCLSCHSDQNNSATPFGDGKTPRQYAWDNTSVDARYSQSAKTSWGKYTSAAYPNAAKKKIDKALSAHGNAGVNQRGWNSTTGVDGAISNTSGAVAVQCYDCHNSHGSAVSGVTSRYSSATGRNKGGILKTTLRGFGGYSATYMPQAAGSAPNKDVRNPGASLCLDCHFSSTPTQAPLAAFKGYTTPWGYNSTFSATQGILGYWDSPFMGYSTAGFEQRYTFKKINPMKGGHFGVSSPLSTQPTAQINGLCTPCHDPHGVSPTLGVNQKYSVPLLKGTWLTSPYKEDTAPALNEVKTEIPGIGEQLPYHIDQNTFGNRISNTLKGVSQSDLQFGGLCLGCHPKTSLTNGSTHTWKDKNRIHESVKDWKTLNATKQHNYSCSKCHSVHTNSALPRLMITNCLDSRHKGRVGSNSDPKLFLNQAFSGYGSGSGGGRIPGSSWGDGDGWDPPPEYYYSKNAVTCHENPTTNNGANSNLDQSWNVVTPWLPVPTLISPTATAVGTTTATLGANVTSNGLSAITDRGTVWGTSTNPTGNAAAEGGTTTGVFSHVRSSITSGAKIYYRGYATNSLGTAYSPNGSFHTEPGTQASGVNFTSVGAAGMTVNWTRGNGDGVIVLIKQGSAVNSDPVDGTYTGYTANTTFGSGTQIGTGNYVVYKGTGTSVAVSGLTADTTYYLAVYEFKGTVDTSGVDQGTNYKSNPVTGSQTTSSPSLPILTSPTAVSIGSTTATLGANITTDGGAITARGTVWGTSANPTGNAATDGGTTTGIFSHARTGLTAGTKIYYRGYATNSIGTGYSPDGSFYTEPSTQASAVTFTSVGSTAMTVNWTRGSGDGVIVLIKQSSAVNSSPVDGTYTGYTANSAFASGTQIGTGNYVVYKGTGTSVAVTGLTSGATYYLAVYEYMGTVDTSDVNQGTNYKPTPATNYQKTDTAPTLSTPTAVSIGSDTATLGANVTSDGGDAITARGTVWGTTATPTGNAAAEGGTTTGVFSHARTAITSGTQIYYRGYATNSVGTGYSPDGSFYTEPSTQASAVNFTSVGDTGMTVNWTRGNGDGAIVLIRQDSLVATDPADGTYTTYTANAAFGSGTPIGAAYVIYKETGTSVAVTGLSSGSTYHVAVYEYKGTVNTSGTNLGANYKSSAATGSQATSGVVPPPAPTLTASAGCGSGVCSSTCAVSLAWSTVTSPDGDPVQYYLQLTTDSTFASVPYNSGWIAGTSWTTPQLSGGTWYWRVMARDSVHTTAMSAYSLPSSFTVSDQYDYCSCYVCDSCPFVFAWDGTKYSYVTDIAGPVIGLPKNIGADGKEIHFLGHKLYQPSYIDLKDLKPDNSGDYRIKLREPLAEMDYLDEMKLLEVDYPKGYEILNSTSELTYRYGYVNPFRIYTIKDPHQPLSAIDKNGRDILAAVLKVDNNTAPAERDDLEYYTFDFGTVRNPAAAKLIIDGWTVFGPRYKKINVKQAVQPYLEVVDKSGKWVKAKSFGEPAGDLKRMVIDIAGIFKSDDHRIRLHRGMRKEARWLIDRIMLDDSAPVPVKSRETSAIKADLLHGGNLPYDHVNLDHRMSAEDSVVPDDPAAYGTGRFTRYGDVRELIAITDDRFVLMRHGDDIELTFPGSAPPEKGMQRGFMLKTKLYYKPVRGSRSIEPLPFSGMGRYPYDEAEEYPRDQKHLDYRNRYNTREHRTHGVTTILNEMLSPHEAQASSIEAVPATIMADLGKSQQTVNGQVAGLVETGMIEPEIHLSLWQWLRNITSKVLLSITAVLVWLKSLVGL